MAEPEIPSYFLCPISLQIMRDPVTLPTGITYDRRSIERWLLASGNHKTCPVTNQPLLTDYDLTPNHTLRRLIQAWCVANAIERVPTPRPPVDRACIAKILDKQALSPPQSQLASLHELKCIISESERNRICVFETPGAVDFLASVILTGKGESDVVDETLDVMVALRLPEHNLIDLVSRNADFIGSLSRFLRSTNAMLLLKSIISVIAPARLIGIQEEVFVEIVNVLRERISAQTTKAALEALIRLCPWGRNRIKAVGAGAVHVLIELLIDADQERRVTEMALAVLDKLSGRAEGRAEIVSHAAGIAVVAKKILRVSSAGNERAVKILQSIATYSATAAVLQEMEQVGVVLKLCTMLMVDCGMTAKERAREVLRLHSRVWRRSPCLSPRLQALYPR